MRRGWLGALALAFAAAAASAAPEAAPPKLTTPADLPRCIDSYGPEPCQKALQEYVKARPDQAFEAGRITARFFAHWVAIPFFVQALAAKADASRCTDERLALAVSSALGQPNDIESAALVASAASILRDRCWRELRAPIIQQIEKDRRGALTRNVCPVFIAKNVEEKSEIPAVCWPAIRHARPDIEPTWEELDVKTIRVEGGASVYGTKDGRRITVVKIEDRPYFLIKFNGFGGSWNGRVIVHRQERAGSGFDFWTPVQGRRYVSVVVRKVGTPGALWEVHPVGAKGSVRVTLDQAATKAAKAEGLLGEIRR